MKQRTKLLLARIFLAAIFFCSISLIILLLGTNGALKYLNNCFSETTQLVLALSTGILGIVFVILFSCLVVKVGGAKTKVIHYRGSTMVLLYPSPPTFVNPTLSTQVLCPFECVCEKHHGTVHEGIDIAPQVPNIEDDPVNAVIKGRIYVDKENGIARIESKMYDVIYRCLKTIDCKDGAKVKPGYRIGTMGGLGTAEGVHLHIEVWNNIDHAFVNPLVFYDWNQSNTNNN